MQVKAREVLVAVYPPPWSLPAAAADRQLRPGAEHQGDFACFLVRCGLDSISLNPDTVLRTSEDIVRAERELEPPAAAPQPAVA